MKTIHLSRLQNVEHLAFVSDIVTLLENVDIEVLNEVKAQFSTSVNNEELAQKEIIKSEHTQSLAELDRKRDDFYRGLEVMIVLDTYGTIISSNYQKETTEIQNIIADLKSVTYTSDVTKIGLTQWITWLEEANNEFNQTYISRRDEYASRPDYNLKAIRKESDTLFKKIQEIVGALQVLQPTEQWKEILALRKGRN